MSRFLASAASTVEPVVVPQLWNPNEPVPTYHQSTTSMLSRCADCSLVARCQKKAEEIEIPGSTLDGRAAVLLYTSESRVPQWESTFSSMIHYALHSTNSTVREPFLPFLHLLFHTLAISPYVHEIYYGQMGNDIAYQYNSVVYWSDFTHCFSDVGTVQEMLGKGPKTIFKISSFSAVNAKALKLSTNPNIEIIQPAFSSFKVTKWYSLDMQVVLVEMEEIVSPVLFSPEEAERRAELLYDSLHLREAVTMIEPFVTSDPTGHRQALLGQIKLTMDGGDYNELFRESLVKIQYHESITHDPRLQNDIGFLFQMGVGGVTQDIYVALEWYKKAAAQGNVWAQYNVGLAYAQGLDGLEVDQEEALKWLHLASAQGDKWATYVIGTVYTEMKRDEEAMHWYLKVSDIVFSQERIGYVKELEGKLGEALHWYRKASKTSADAFEAIGSMLLFHLEEAPRTE